MQVGLIGAGNMARALALGWGEPLLVSDAIADKARALAGELGGEAVDGNAQLAERAELVVLCHKPAQLEAVAAEVAPARTPVASILGGVSLEALEAAYPDVPVVRLIPNVAAEVRRGVTCYAPGRHADAALEQRVTELFGRVGTVVPLDERLIDAATGVMSVAPAYVALLIEAQVEAGIRAGLTAEQASTLAASAFAGSAELIAARGGDTLAVRRAVTSPGGITARGLAALERAGVRAAFIDAMDAVLGADRQ